MFIVNSLLPNKRSILFAGFRKNNRTFMWCENEIEYILEHLQDPERLMDGEFVEWLEKKEHLALFEKILCPRDLYKYISSQRRKDRSQVIYALYTKRIS